MLTANLRRHLVEGVAEVQFDYPLKRHTTLGIGGIATAFARINTPKELAFVLQLCEREKLPFLCLGKGSNVLLTAKRFAGVVFLLAGEFREVEKLSEHSGQKQIIRAGAGISLARLAAFCTEQGLSGLEFAAGIPGTLGGAVLMNAGAWGEEMAGIVRCVELQDRDSTIYAKNEQLDFGYRAWPWLSCNKRQQQMVITAAELHLQKAKSVTIASRCQELTQKRREKQQVRKPNAGSFFKNPVGESAGRLIESCGLKGLRVGDAMVAEEHANFLVNMGSAEAGDMLELMEMVQKTVKQRTGVLLEPEVRIIN